MSMTALLERTKETNDVGYASVNARELKPIGDFFLVQWQLCQEHIRVGKTTLVRPDNFRKMHYTGNVIAVGPEVNEEIKPGCRIAFDQFSDPDKFWDDELGRVALLKEDKQGALLMVISPRTKVEGSELDYNYEK